MTDAERIYFAMWHARCLGLRHLPIESCIYSSKLLSHLLPELIPGLRVMAVPVGAVAMNQRALDLVMAGEATKDDEKALTVSCNFKGDISGPMYRGHLILVGWSEQGEWLIDGSADQFSQHDKDLIVEPSVMEMPEGMKLTDWLDGTDALSYALKDGGSISYEPHTETTLHQGLMDWIEVHPGEKGYDYVAERVAALMDLYGDLDHLTPAQLPDLPKGLSSKFSHPALIQAQEMRAFHELGYTQQEMLERKQREDARDAARTMEAAAESWKLSEEKARSLGATLRQAAALMHPRGQRP